MKRTGLGLLVAALAFGFSAFTTIKKRGIMVFYKTSMTYPLATDPRGYTYFSADRCEAGGYVCSAQWMIPVYSIVDEGDPLPANSTFELGSVIEGHFE
ncbi:MAG: hypothetical protein EOO88_20760 [Pedobacter sp.]|nr:MAG: hypothetical protein EOO88_20760 [Pedobacter sp.]